MVEGWGDGLAVEGGGWESLLIPVVGGWEKCCIFAALFIYFFATLFIHF
jgi:hypothetical protein